MDHDDPISQFFPGEEEVDLYEVLRLGRDASINDIKKSYRCLALLYHPDKHATADENAKLDASTKFQQIGFAYAVLSDSARKERYDRTGKTDEGFPEAENGWEAYFEELFDKVTKGKLDEVKRDYQGSAEELEDIKQAYHDCSGDIEEIMNRIPHSTHDDEPRIIEAVNKLVKEKLLKSTSVWETSTGDVKAKKARKTKGEKEAQEAEQHAKELGVWDEFYGSGKPDSKRKRGKRRGATEPGDDGDYSALQALILGKRKTAESFLDSLAEKYAAPPAKKKKRGADVDAIPGIDNAAFQGQPLMAQSTTKKTTARRKKK